MNKDNKYLQKYIKSRIKGKDKFSHMNYCYIHNGQEFNFEFVGLSFINLVCSRNSMSYSLHTSIYTCGCSDSDCIHKVELKDYFEMLLLKHNNS